jgi:DNA-binding HxlR family transcriptional regulator
MAIASPPAAAKLAAVDPSRADTGTAGGGFEVSALGRALVTVGDRWSLAVVARLTVGPQRFNDLATALAPIARTVLSDRLRRLEEAGVLARRQYSEAPARWNYRLTMAGADLARVCGVLADWSARHLVEDGEPVLLHRGCSNQVMPAWRCEECGPVPSREVYDTSMPQE